MSLDIDWIDRAGAAPKGHRPEYLGDMAVERILSVLLAVTAELSAVRERQDTTERLLEAGGALNRADIETYAPDAEAAYERGVATKAYIARVMRGLQQEMEAMERFDPPIDDICKELSIDHSR